MKRDDEVEKNWQRLAYAVKEAADGCCRLCPRHAPYPYHGLEAHHRTRVRQGRERLGDLTCLCSTCHAHHEWRKKYGDLMDVRAAEVLGLIEQLHVEIGEVHEFYWQHVRRWYAILAELKEEVGLYLAGSAAEAEYLEGEGRRAA